MNTRKLTTFVVAAALTVPAAAITAQQFGRDSVYATTSETSASNGRVAVGEIRMGRDSVYAKDTNVSRSSPSQQADVSFKPGRA